MKCIACWLFTIISFLLADTGAHAQQLKLGNDPYTVNKSAVLELNSTNQGLLLVRISDTMLINVMAPPDGMMIYFTPTKQLFVRSNGFWKPLTYADGTVTNWSLKGNAGINNATDFLGTTDDKALMLKSNNSSYAEFGRRQTLGLTQAYADYTNDNEQVLHLKSSLQFLAPGADFYKPKIFVDAGGNFRIKGSAAGTDYFELGSTGAANNGGFEFIIGDDGNEPIAFKSYNYLTGMSEMMRLQSGRMAIGSISFDATNPEKLLIDAGTTDSYNLIAGKGSINNYLQLNVQNRSNGNTASSDIVATSDNGTEVTNFVNLGINSSGFTNMSYPILSGSNNAYLYSTGNDFIIGNGTASKSLTFFTGGFAALNERMRISASGFVGIGTTGPSTQLHIKTGIANDGGLRLENLTSTSAITNDAAVIGVDGNGKVVRARTPTYYHGTGVATVNDITKIWVAEVDNTSSGSITVTIPANIGFTTIASVQVTAKGGTSLTNYPIATVVSTSLTTIVIKVLESKTTSVFSTAEGIESHNDTGTNVYIRVEGY